MCGVVGAVIKFSDIEAMTIIELLMLESKIRGMHSYGMSVKTKDDPIVTTINQDIDTAILTATKLVSKEFICIGHCRYSTSGNQAQPLRTNLGTSLVFNGNIHMGTKEEMEHYFQIKMQTDNDGEVFLLRFRQATQLDELITFINSPGISFAGLMIFGNWFLAVHNKMRPLYRAFYSGNTYYASTADIFKRVGLDKVEEVPVNTWIRTGLI